MATHITNLRLINHHDSETEKRKQAAQVQAKGAATAPRRHMSDTSIHRKEQCMESQKKETGSIAQKRDIAKHSETDESLDKPSCVLPEPTEHRQG